MTNIDRDIGTDDKRMAEFVDSLAGGKFLIPAFQRESVWEPDNIIKLWDSILQFYPVGSILYWRTDGCPHTHRKPSGLRHVPQWRFDFCRGDFE